MAGELPVIGVSALVRRDGCILLVRRARPPNLGLWALPGGRLQSGERLAEGVAREVREETGLVVTGLEQIATVEILPNSGSGDGRHFVLLVFSATPLPGAPVAGDDAAEARWASAEEVRALPLTEETRAVIEKHGFDER
jgi:8-oxo-dGTP diphosphatase